MPPSLSSAAHPGGAGLPAGGPDDPDAVGARLAATVILLRDGAQGPQVLMMRRAERTGDLRSGVWVFPGGAVDADDTALAGVCDGPDDALWSQRLGLPHGGLQHVAAALRECFEEVGLLPGVRAQDGGAWAGVLAGREGCTDAAAFAALCRRHGLRLDTSVLRVHSHWLTPPGVPRRFDTRFFVCRMPEGQVPRADEGEALELAWLTPAQALDPGRALKLLPVTRRTLRDLLPFGSVQACLDDAEARGGTVRRRMPRLGLDPARGGHVRPVLPDEWAWAEIGRLDPQGRGDVPIDLQPLRVATLSARLRRITCSNGSVMTGPGTNTYLLRAPGSDRVAVLDPGPDDAQTEAHLAAVLGAAQADGGRIAWILATHTHRDHSPAALRLQALAGGPGAVAVWGRRAAHPQGQDPTFAPDHEPADGERLTLGPGCTLRAVATPGHASNHLCWLLEEESLLFTGDHVMQGSTVVINPPDGDMAAYFDSLQRLLAQPLDWLAPGHGFLIGQPHDEVRRLLAHRQAREAKVLAALRDAAPAGRPPVAAEALVPAVYGDVPPARHGLAARSLTAHLLKLAAEGRVRPHAAADGVRHWGLDGS